MGYTSVVVVRKWIHIEIENRFNLIHEKEWTAGESVSDICKRYGTSRKSYYKWNNRYKEKGIDGLSDLSRRPHTIKYKKITSEIEETILDLRITKRFGCSRIRFRLRRTIGVSLSTRTIYKMLKRHDLNILKSVSPRYVRSTSGLPWNIPMIWSRWTFLDHSIWVILVQRIISSAA